MPSWRVVCSWEIQEIVSAEIPSAGVIRGCEVRMIIMLLRPKESLEGASVRRRR